MYSSTVTHFEEPRKRNNGLPEDIAAEPVQVPLEAAEQPLIWRNVIGLAIMYTVAVYTLVFRYRDIKFWTWIFGYFYGFAGGLGVTAGAHRLWAHRSYSAKTPLKILLALFYCMAGQTSPHSWVRDHRTHHRYTETPADPHDANRGFFFSHVGWLMMRRHPAVKTHGSKVDMSDILGDPVLRFFNKYYTPIMICMNFALPAIIPVYVWGESWEISSLAVMTRYVWLLNAAFAVNSFAHMWGNRPYNGEVKATENSAVSFFAIGEGWHNYHHSFPWDYKAAELGAYGLNPTTGFIEFMAWLGLAYNLKTPSKKLVERTSVNKGDGTDSFWGNHHEGLHQNQHQHHHRLHYDHDYQNIKSR